MTPAERSIRMRTNMVILTPGDRGYQEWADRRELLRLLDDARRSLEDENPCCYSLHEFEQVCPRTGRTFMQDVP